LWFAVAVIGHDILFALYALAERTVPTSRPATPEAAMPTPAAVYLSPTAT
jgi:hypothetical protein